SCLMILLLPSSTLFPTRRSSDLGEVMATHGHRRDDHRRIHNEYRDDEPTRVTRSIDRHDAEHRVERGKADDAVDLRHVDDRERRSEEHTSELQSRENLVCRLLLE